MGDHTLMSTFRAHGATFKASVSGAREISAERPPVTYSTAAFIVNEAWATYFDPRWPEDHPYKIELRANWDADLRAYEQAVARAWDAGIYNDYYPVIIQAEYGIVAVPFFAEFLHPPGAPWPESLNDYRESRVPRYPVSHDFADILGSPDGENLPIGFFVDTSLSLPRSHLDPGLTAYTQQLPPGTWYEAWRPDERWLRWVTEFYSTVMP